MAESYLYQIFVINNFLEAKKYLKCLIRNGIFHLKNYVTLQCT